MQTCLGPVQSHHFRGWPSHTGNWQIRGDCFYWWNAKACKLLFAAILQGRMQRTSSFNTYSHKIVARLNTPATEDTINSPQQPHPDRFGQPQMLGRLSKLPISKLIKPIQFKRFHKHKNLIETNRSNLSHVATPLLKNRHMDYSFQHSNILNRKRTLPLQAKTKEQLFSSFPQQQPTPQSVSSTPLAARSQKLQSILLKNHLKNQRNLLGYNILHLQQKYHFSRFELHSLYSMYHTLMRDSKGEFSRFKSSFEAILNTIKIAIRPEILESIFSNQQKLDFQSFIEMYSRIDEAIFKQTIIDYVELLFAGLYEKLRIRYDDIVRIMKNRITEKESEDMAKIIFEQLDRNTDRTVSLDEINLLCHTSQTFAKKMFRLYSGETM